MTYFPKLSLLVGGLFHLALCKSKEFEYVTFYSSCIARSVHNDCCSETFEFHGTRRACTWLKNQRRLWCLKDKVWYVCKVNYMPEAGFAHPLGMQSGKIKKSHLTSYAGASQDALTKARLFGPNGWRPDDAYLSKVTANVIPLSLKGIMNAPIFFQITFERRKKVSYFAIQDNDRRTAYSQTFYIAFNDRQQKAYGGSSARDLRCEQKFGVPESSCKHILSPPFRAITVRIVAKDYQKTYKPQWKIELGGLDYLEADHYWPLNKVMYRENAASVEIPDERGNMNLQSDIKALDSASTVIGTRVEYANDLRMLASKQNTSASKSLSSSHESRCLRGIDPCEFGLSVTLWINTAYTGTFITTQSDRTKGFHISSKESGKIRFNFRSASKVWKAAYILKECDGISPCSILPRWIHLGAVWNRTTLVVYINGAVKGGGIEQDSMHSAVGPSLKLKKLLGVREIKLWTCSLSEIDVMEMYRKTKIDFTIMAFDDTGDWETGTGCTATKGTGPCQDQSLWETPAETVGSLRFSGHFADMNTYRNYRCSPSFESDTTGKAKKDYPIGVATTMGFTVELFDHINYEQLESFKVHFIAGHGSTSTLTTNIYTASTFNYNGQYQLHCRMANFRRDLFYGPITWKTGPWSSGKEYESPDIATIVRPLLSRSNLIWRKYFFVIFEWVQDPGKDVRIVLNSQSPSYYTFTYKDNNPDKYLYADATKALHPGYPLTYTTKPLIPTKKCLSFWYHMYGRGIGILSVNVKQEPTVFKEVFRLYGDQGDRWIRAQVPITGLNETSYQFQVIFTAIRGETTVGDIAIDTIEVTARLCIRIPDKAKQEEFNSETFKTTLADLGLPVPAVFLPLDQSPSAHAASQPVWMERNEVGHKLVSDMFGFPIARGYFDEKANLAFSIKSSQPLLTGSDFTLSVHVRPAKVKDATIIWIGSSSPWLSVEVVNGLIVTSVSDESGPSRLQSSITLQQFVWSSVAIVYSRSDKTVSTYLNSKKTDAFSVGNLSQVPISPKFLIGDKFPSQPAKSFLGHITCLQLYETPLENHLISITQLCPNRHVKGTCNVTCRADGVCDQLTRKCRCPQYANKYVNADCSNALKGTINKKAIGYVDFDSRKVNQLSIGPGAHYQQMHSAEKDSITGLYFTVAGPANLAVCTASDSALPLNSLDSSCIVGGTCDKRYSVSFWTLIPPITKIKAAESFTLLRAGSLTMTFVKAVLNENCSQKVSHSFRVNVTSGAKVCEWETDRSNSHFSIWTHLTVSFDSTNDSLSIYYDGKKGATMKRQCYDDGNTARTVLLGGGMPMQCFDEFSLWGENLDGYKAKMLYNAIATSGYERRPPKSIAFHRLSFSDVKGWLWATDVEYNVYVYHPDQYWMKVGGRMLTITVCKFGVWAVDLNRKLRFRKGVNHSNPGGTSWLQVNEGSYGNRELKTVSNGFGDLMYFIEFKTRRLYCMEVTAEGSVLFVHETAIWIKGIACSNDKCCTFKEDGSSYCFKSYTSCHSTNLDSLRKLPYSSHYLSTDSLDHFFRLWNGQLHRWQEHHSNWRTVEIKEKLEAKSVLSINGQPVIVTKSGNLKMIGSGDDVFKIIHSGGYCLRFAPNMHSNDYRIRLKESCELFRMEESGCIRHMGSYLFLQYGKVITFSPTCQNNDAAQGFKRENYSTISKNRNLMTPIRHNMFPTHNVGVVFASFASSPMQIFEHHFLQASPFKRINSFYPRKATQGTVKGEIIISIMVSFRFRDLEYINIFRDKDGIEATSIHRKVEIEVKQIFAESDSFIKSHYGEIGSGDEVKFDCLSINGCFKPLDVKFQGFLYFSYISDHERGILASKKFNGTLTDCQNSECKFNLDEKYKRAYITPSKLRLINKTSTSFLFQYTPREKHGAHVGYLVSFNGSYMVDGSAASHVDSYKLHDGLLFNVSCLLPYHRYELTITPLEVQSELASIKMVEATLASVPSAAPNVTLDRKGKHKCFIHNSGIPTPNWNGVLLGYQFYYAELRTLTEAQRLTFNAADAGAYKTHVENGIEKGEHAFKELHTYTEYVFYIGGFNKVGVGALAKVECTTSEGAPDHFGQAFSITSVNVTHVVVRWLPCSDSDQFWNTDDTISREYEIYVTETSYPRNWDTHGANYSTLHPLGAKMVGPLEADYVYSFRMAAKNHKGSGKTSEMVCIRMREGVPNATVGILHIISNTSESLVLAIGDVELQHENGRIVYYNVSVTKNTTGESSTEFYMASIGNLDRGSENPGSALPLVPRTCTEDGKIQLVNCSTEPSYIKKTSIVTNLTISNLSYWTEYEVKASACTCIGCGPYSVAVHAKTDYHEPTCSTEWINAIPSTSTSLNFTWVPLESNCTHGYFAGYRVYFGKADAFTGSHNYSRDWQVYDENDVKEVYFIETVNEEMQFNGLEKYSNYCVAISGSTVKGHGPISAAVCNFTLEDRPDGPPRNVSASFTIENKVQVFMRIPDAEECNGIILGYVLYYREATNDGSSSQEFNQTLKRIDDINGYTSMTMEGLKSFTWYRIEVAAYTAMGEGKRSNNSILVLSPEGIPSGVPMNLTISNQTDVNITIEWSQASSMNGVFRMFIISINETLADGRDGLFRMFNGTTNFTILHGSQSDEKNAVYNVKSHHEADLIEIQYKNAQKLFSVTIAGLRPFTNYTISIASCTNPGCGSSSNTTTRTEESPPAKAPKSLTARNASVPTSLLLTWEELPLMERNGLVLGYRLKWIKRCHLLFLQNATINQNDCTRVLNQNVSNFKVKFVLSSILQYTIAQLSPFTNYTIRIAAVTSAGVGPEMETIALTDEGVPTRAPVVTSAFNTSGKSIQIEWVNIPLPYQNGFLLGYTVHFHRTDQNSSASKIVNCSTSHENVTKFEIRELDLHTNYTFAIGGFTGKGVGMLCKKFIAQTGPFSHGQWSDWGEWSSCSRSCGGGEKARQRFCNDPSPWNGGDDCKGKRHNATSCNTRRCSGLFLASPGENCKTFCRRKELICNAKLDLDNSTEGYQQAGVSCKNAGLQSIWKKFYHPVYMNDTGICVGFRSIPRLVSCNATPPIDARTRRLCNCFDRADVGFSAWATWSYCSKSCGGGKKRSKRECNVPDGCTGKVWQSKDCNAKRCPVDGQWGQWSSITNCNQTCGYGYQHRYRKCDSPAAAYGGEKCYGPTTDYIGGCNAHLCPIHGSWSSWECTHVCDQACGGGLLVRRRFCDHPKPELNGEYCRGRERTVEPCNVQPCKGVKLLFWFHLTDYQWNFMYYSLNNEIAIKLASIIHHNVLQLYNGASFLSGMRVKSFMRNFPSQRSRRDTSKTHVVANVALFYSESAQSEIIYLQDYVASKNRLFSLNVSRSSSKAEEILSNPPENLAAVVLDPHTVNVTWSPPANATTNANLTNIYLFYREKNTEVGSWEVRGIPLTKTSYSLTRLKPKTWYKLRATACKRDGNGPATDELLVETSEGAPSMSPKNLRLIATQPTEIYVQWDPIGEYFFHGLPLGYRVRYKNYNEKDYKEIKVPYGASEVTLVGLQSYSMYVVIVCGYTAVGNGPRVNNATRTLEGVPSEPPPGIQVQHKISLDTIIVMWSAIDEKKANGRFKGYKVKYTVEKIAGVDAVISGSNTKEIVVDKYTFRVKINGLLSYASYKVSVCGYTEAGNGPFSKAFLADTCKCPNDIYINWYESRPYLIKRRNGTIHGLFKVIADGMIKTSCDACNGVTPRVNYKISPVGESPEKKSELQLKAKIGNGYHMSFPIFGRAEMRNFMDGHVFIELVRSPGSAIIVNGDIDYTAKTINALKSIVNVWPIILITVLLSFISGILVWSVDQFYNEEFAYGKYMYGMFQGFWWAFVSMTTVGYGDITPRSVPGRIIATVWTLIGLILVGILTGALTSTVTTLTIKQAAKLYDTKTAVIYDTFDDRLAIRRNAKVSNGTRFQTASDVLTALRQKRADVALLDAFVTAAQKSNLVDMKLKVKKVISANSAYGFVLSKEMVRLEYDFKSHISSQQGQITRFISRMTDKLEISNEKTPQIQLFDPNTPAFWIVLHFELSLLGIFIAFGIIWTAFNRYRKHRKVGIPRDPKLAMVDAFEDMLKDFHVNMTADLNKITSLHGKELLDLINMRGKAERNSERKQRSGFWYS